MRLAATMKLDLRLQLRNHLYLFTAVTTLFVVAFLRLFIPREALGVFLPAILFFGLGGTTAMFVAAQILFEKGERTLEAMNVTPLRAREYLLSKLLTLTALATLEGLAIVILSYGFALNLIMLLLGMIILAAFYALVGFIAVVRYDSATRFLMIVGPLLTPLFIPALGLFGLWSSPILYLWPTQAPLLILEGAFYGLPYWQLLYAVAYSALALLGLYLWAQRAFYAHVVRARG